MEQNLNSYLTTALWSSLDERGTPLDDTFEISDFSEEFLKKSLDDLKSFSEKAGVLLNGLDLNQVAHDFWLTRNGHGAGFWDGDYEEEIGEKLTNISKEFGEVNLFVNDDGKIYCD